MQTEFAACVHGVVKQAPPQDSLLRASADAAARMVVSPQLLSERSDVRLSLHASLLSSALRLAACRTVVVHIRQEQLLEVCVLTAVALCVAYRVSRCSRR